MVLSACSNEPESGPDEVRWDRDACKRCRMVLSDKHYAAQIRYFPEGKRSKVVKFDDIGCATIWLEDKQWKNHPKTEIWVADHHSGDWIDAVTAIYVHTKTSPMEYALGAQTDADEQGLTFEQAKLHIEEVEKKFNVHGLQLQQQGLKQQGEARESLK